MILALCLYLLGLPVMWDLLRYEEEDMGQEVPVALTAALCLAWPALALRVLWLTVTE